MWYQLQIEQCSDKEVDLISSSLEDTGSISITLTDKNDDPILEPELGSLPLWPEVVIHALYDDLTIAKLAKETISQQYPHLRCQLEELPDKDWETVWMNDFKPQCFGKKLWICPSWLTPPDPTAVNLILDPGLAFGTGHHPTTHLCLKWLDNATLAGRRVIDYGCGSGILALAALKLGAKEAIGIDIDPQALQATVNNALMNDVSKNLVVNFPDVKQEPADIIIANILLLPLMGLQQNFYDLLNPGGQLVVSGILNEQTQSLIDAYQPQFSLQSRDQLEDWSLLVFDPKNHAR